MNCSYYFGLDLAISRRHRAISRRHRAISRRHRAISLTTRGSESAHYLRSVVYIYPSDEEAQKRGA